MDLGTCQKIHNPALKADFIEASKKRDYGYDIDVSILFNLLSYDLRKFCNLIGWEEWYFSVTVRIQAFRSEMQNDHDNSKYEIQDWQI